MFDGGGELVFDVPGEMDPLVLLKFFHAGIDDGATGGLGVEGGEVSLREELADDAGGLAGVDEVVDEEVAVAVAGDAFEDVDAALDLRGGVALAGLVAGDADGVDEADLELTGDEGGGDEAAAGDGDDAFPRADGVEHLGEITGVAVKLDPGDDDIVGVGIAGHGAEVVLRRKT